MFCSPQLRVLLYFFSHWSYEDEGQPEQNDLQQRTATRTALSIHRLGRVCGTYDEELCPVFHANLREVEFQVDRTDHSTLHFNVNTTRKWGTMAGFEKLRSPDRLQDAQYLQTHPIVPLFSHSAQWMKRTSSGSTNPVCFEWERSLQSIISWSPRCATCALDSASAHEWMISGTNMNLFVVLFLSQAEMESDRIIDMTRWVHQYLGEVALLSETAARRVIVVYKIYAYDISQRWDTSRRRT